MRYISSLFLMLTILFLECKSETKQNINLPATDKIQVMALEQGKEITSATFVTLASELQKAMKDGGVKEAVNYCKLNALSITDSLASRYKVDIKRTSDKVRNPKNTATTQELAIINKYKGQLKSGKIIKPMIVKDQKHRTYYAPIISNDLCLKCHGKKEDIPDYQTIAELYPKDLATGYDAGDLRGIWSVTFRN